VQFVFTSDPYFGINRKTFHEEKNVDARYANREMIAKINALPNQSFPKDGEFKSGQMIGGFDFLVVGGNIAHRMEASLITQTAKASWKEFDKEYLQSLTLKAPEGTTTPVYMTPGVHDQANAIGYYKRLDPKTDPSVMVEIYNRMVNPSSPITNEIYDAKKNRVHYSRTVKGVHLIFVNVWPDSTERAWIEQDLQTLAKGTPVLLFSNIEPDAGAKYFTNPNGKHDVNKNDKFENVIGELFQGGTKVEDKAIVHERALADFVKKHIEIKGYFHGNVGMTDIKVWMGPDYDFMLPAFSVDSPVKGDRSAKDENLVSFLVVNVDLDSKQISARECRWNANPILKDGPMVWGNHASFEFRAPTVVETPAPKTTAVPTPVLMPVVTDSIPSVQ
jgi:hypothetical protein